MTESLNKELVVAGSPERAFRVFTEGIDRWWPRDHHHGTSPLAKIVLEPRLGGRWFSHCEDGSEVEIGKVLVCEPGRRLVVTWQLDADFRYDEGFVTEVEVRFSPAGDDKTRVEFEHRGLERYGAHRSTVAEALGRGWGNILGRYDGVARLKAVVLYQSAPDVLQKAPLHFPAHKARLDAFTARGEVLGVGTFADPREGSLAIFSDREAAEAFVRDDPFVVEGVVARAVIHDWNDAMLSLRH